MDLNDVIITPMGTSFNVSSLEAGCSGQSKTLEAAIAQFAMSYHEGRIMAEENKKMLKEIVLSCITHAIEERKSSGKTLDELDDLYYSVACQAAEDIVEKLI
jgi:hypothetical protein